MYYRCIVDVANSNVDKLFDYSSGQDIEIGTRVLLPFGNRTIQGFVLDKKENTDIDKSKIKSIIRACDPYPIILPDLMKLMHFMVEYYHLRYIDVIKLIVPNVIRSDKVKSQISVECTLNDDNIVQEYLKHVRKNAINVFRAIYHLQQNGKDNIINLNKMFSSTTIKKLIGDQIIITTSSIKNRLVYEKTQENDIILNDTQKQIVDTVCDGDSKTYLLHGVTGSGKTEVYMNIIKQKLASGKGAIMLVPEISLTPQVVKNFTAKFGQNIAVLHSGLSSGEKYDEWKRIFNGEARVVIGARSAIFAPVHNLGCIIIDEEHDSSYFSESNPRYHTHKVAEFRAKTCDCPLILGSATPSVESYHNAMTGQYTLLEMPVRINNLPMPTIEIVDMCKAFRNGNTSIFSQEFLGELQNTIEHNEQCIVFINRRGFASFLMCRQCGYIPKCTECDVSLVYHKRDNELKCHYCGKRFHNINVCPVCGSHEIKLGGVGTERVVQELKEHFPNVPIYRMDNDTTRTKNAHGKILEEFGSHHPSILVGTQMIAKGHDFPDVTLVGILDADLSLFFNDFRATEKTYQLVTQVSGRAGRSKKSGKVILQTFFPKNYVYRFVANYDYKGFFQKEDNLRMVTNFPPYSNMIRILITSEDDDKAKLVSHNFFMKLKELRQNRPKDFYFLEGMKSPITKIQNKHRYQIVLRVVDNFEIIDKIYNIEKEVRDSKVSVFIELNAQNLS